ncbi:hypothetical protein [Clostridium sp. CM028]|nr:hypothetical protein [Clostridium sp. CM028]
MRVQKVDSCAGNDLVCNFEICHAILYYIYDKCNISEIKES